MRAKLVNVERQQSDLKEGGIFQDPLGRLLIFARACSFGARARAIVTAAAATDREMLGMVGCSVFRGSWREFFRSVAPEMLLHISARTECCDEFNRSTGFCASIESQGLFTCPSWSLTSDAS